MSFIKYAIGITLAALFIAVPFLSPSEVKALNALTIKSTNSDRNATSTTRYMTAGTATTTLTLNTQTSDQVNLNIMYQASSTVGASLKWRYEFSVDGISWFADDTTINELATSTQHVGSFEEHTWAYASSTAGSSVSNTAYKHTRKMNIASPLTRVVFYVPTGSLPAQIYVQAVQKDNNAI